MMAKTFVTFSAPLESALEKYPDHVRAIGMISIEIANMEISIAHLLGPLLDIDAHKARIVYFTPKANIARLDIVQNLISTLPAEHKAAGVIIDRILTKARGIFQKRHTLIHNAWGFSEESNEVITSSLPDTVRFDSKPLPITELNDLISRIRKINTDAWNARAEVANILRPDMSPQIWIEIGAHSERPKG